MKYAEDHDDVEYADSRKRRLTPAQRARFVEAWKAARDSGRLKAPLKVSTAEQLLIAAAVDR